MRRRYRYLIESEDYDSNAEIIKDPNFTKKIDNRISDAGTADATNVIKPYASDKVLAQYVAALRSADLPCPRSIEEMQNLPFFKKIAQGVIDSGFTIEEVRQLYNDNINMYNRRGTTVRLKDRDKILGMYLGGYNQKRMEDNDVYGYTDRTDNLNTRSNNPYPEQKAPIIDNDSNEIGDDDDFFDDEFVPFEEEYDLSAKEHDDYMNKLRKTVITNVEIGDYLAYDFNNPMNIRVIKPTQYAKAGEKWVLFAKCVIRAYQTSDKKPRFVPIKNGKLFAYNNISVEHKGNDNRYNDYVYDVQFIGSYQKLKPASAFYREDIKFGKDYTEVLAEIGNEAARKCIEFDRGGKLPQLKGEWYLPTFQELILCLDNLTIDKTKIYWSSSVPDSSRSTNYAIGANHVFILSDRESGDNGRFEIECRSLAANALPFLKF